MVSADSVSISILVLLTFLSAGLLVYSVLFLYGKLKAKLDKDLYTDKGKWLENDREPLIPGNFHAETIQPTGKLDDHDLGDDSMDETDYKPRDDVINNLGRIIFVMRYQKRREELMIRLVQIEGLPVSQELYNPNSAYVDVQLKYTGSENPDKQSEIGKPRLDICLQQVYYFIISPHQMMTHTVEFQINTFDDEFRRYVSGVVQVNLLRELADDLWTGAEVVFVKDIEEPFKVSPEEVQQEFIEEDVNQSEATIPPTKQNISRQSSNASSNMSWEPESRDLLTLSANSLLNIRPYEEGLNNTLSEYKRAHSVGYLPTYEWTVKDIPLDEEELDHPKAPQTVPQSAPKRKFIPQNISKISRMTPPIEAPLSPPDNLTFIGDTLEPTPASFYHIVPMTPLFPNEQDSKKNESFRQVMYKKRPKHKKMTRSVTVNKRSTPKHEPKPLDYPPLERSASWPDLTSPVTLSSTEITPEHTGDIFFN